MTRALLVVMLAGCTDVVQLDTHLAGLVSLEVAPADTTIALLGLDAAPQLVAYTATGQFSDGSTRDVTGFVTWSVDNALPGAIDPHGMYLTSSAAAGHVGVTASANAIAAGAKLTVTLDATIVDAAFPPPGDPTALFPAGAIAQSDPMRSPRVSYPSTGTAFPQGVARTLVQYERGMQNDAFRLTFANDVLHLVVISAADRWSADGAAWTAIAGSGIGQQIRLIVDGTASPGGGGIYASGPVSLVFTRDRPDGPLTYWSAATSGVTRGALGATAASKLYPTDTTCVGCHTISRDGRAMALGYGGEILQTVTLPALVTEISADKIPMGWATYSPDGSRLLVANKGVLALYDAHTGKPVGSPDGRVHLPPMTFATHPDWSPDGGAVAVAITTMAPTNMDVKAASIAVLPWDGTKLGMPKTIVRAAGMENLYFPRWSPDGKYLAFVRATETSHGAASAELELVAAAGGTAIALAAASHRVASIDGVANLASSMPAWAPAQGDLAWLAFTSVRPYGAVLPAPARGQIWIAGIDLANSDGDPSYAAFWLPCQDVSVLENNPVWSVAAQTTDAIRTGSR